ncbi:hypothetical protein B0H67DRAFT_606174 [Lasiosphaeris hirsuta]|uniref:BTB domain-containing protein n=1 Tax=Lasiosphaeris hirsuta TaxID=260670 RepID=A0AA40E7U6_9PEZI|nr:hypothetical protein B0H67DRAFT_606174 [Lasiosphaeris hirsuta]
MGSRIVTLKLPLCPEPEVNKLATASSAYFWKCHRYRDGNAPGRTRQRKFVVHKDLLVNSCNYFKAALCDGFYQEGVHNTIELEDDDPEAIAVFVGYIYQEKVPKIELLALNGYTPSPSASASAHGRQEVRKLDRGRHE